MKKTNKLISILLVMAMLLSMAPLSLTAFAAPGEITIHNSSAIFTNGNPVIIEAASKAGYSKIKVDGAYLDFSKYKYSDGEPMFTLGNDKYEADLSGTDIKGAYDAYTGDINITMNGGVVDYISGSCANMISPILNGNINITVNGGQVKEIWGAEYGVNGNINITMTGGTVTIGIYVLYRSDYTLNGDVRVTVTGGSPGLIRLNYGFAELNGKAHLYSSVMRDERINDFDNAVYLYGSDWKSFGDTAAALNGETLVIDADQSLTVNKGETFTGKVQNNGTVIVKNGGEFYASTKNYGTVYAYGYVGNIDNYETGKIIKKVTASGKNVTFNDSEWQNDTFNYRTDYTATLVPTTSGYSMPSSVTVMVGADTLAASDYTYNAATGELSIPSAKITDDTTVSALALLDISGSAVEVTLDCNRFIYNGEPISVKPQINGLDMDENNYTLEYSDNLNAGTGTVTITGKNSYTGSVTLEYIIYPASMFGAEVTLADTLVYNGLEQVMEVDSVVLNGKTFKEGVDYEVIENAATYAGVYTLEVIGINNVEDSIPVDWEIKTRPVTVTADDMTKTYGTNDPENLTYSIDLPTSRYRLNGSPERNEGENVGVYLIREGTLTNENNPNYDITFVCGKFTIEPDVSAIEGLNVHNVESSDKAALEAVIAQISNAETYHASEEKIAEWDLIKDNCVEMLRMIESVENQIKSFEDDLAKYDISTVTSDNAAELERFQNSVGKFYNDYYDNLTDEQENKITDIFWAIENLETIINDVANEIKRITDAVNGYDKATVKSSDKADLEQLLKNINALTTGKNITDSERADLLALADTVNGLIAVINDTADEINRIVSEVDAYDINTVTGDDVQDLLGLIDAANALLETDNLTAEETETLNQAVKDVQSLISIYDRVSAQIGSIKDRLNGYDEETVNSSDKADIEQLKADIKKLTDGQNLTADEREYLVNADKECDKLLAKIAETTAKYERLIAAANSYDEATVTSTDTDALLQLYDDIFDFAPTYNITSDERTSLLYAHTNVFYCFQKITYVSDEIKRIVAELEMRVFESVKSTDKADIQQLIADIKALLDTQNITAEERALLEGADETCRKLIAKIDETAAEIIRVESATDAYEVDTVTSAEKSDIEKLLADIKALADGDNTTADEKKQLEDNVPTLNKLLDKIAETADEIKRIEDAVNGYNEENVKSSDKADIQQLISDIKALLDTQNITAEERILLEGADETCRKLITKIDETAAEINRVESATDAYEVDTVTSAEKSDIEKLFADIKALTDGDNTTADEKKQLEDNVSMLNELLDKIAETADEIKRIEDAVNGYNEENVKSSNEAAIEQLKKDIEALKESVNLTEEEKAALEGFKSAADELTDKIEETQAEIDRINQAVNGYDEETVSSKDEEEINKLREEIQAVINSGNITEEEKKALEDILAKTDVLAEKADGVTEKIEAIEEAVEGYDKATVNSSDKAAIEQLKENIAALESGSNLTAEEKAALEEYKSELNALIYEIEKASQAVEKAELQLRRFDEDRVTIFWEEDIKAVIAEIDELLADRNMGEAEKAKLGELKAEAEKLIEIINDPVEYASFRMIYFFWDCINWKLSELTVFINNIFAKLAA